MFGIDDALAIGGPLIGGLFGAKSAGDAAEAQMQAAQLATEEQRRQFDITRADQEPWRAAGTNAINQLQYLLGIGGRGGTPTRGAGYDAARQNYLQAQQAYNALQNQSQGGYYGRTLKPGTRAYDENAGNAPGYFGDAATQNTASLDAARKRMEDARRAMQAASRGGSRPNNIGGGYGSLMRDFSLADFQADPGYEFRLGEGSKAIERSAAARGMQLSGANLKGLTRYNQDFASNEFGNAYNRDAANKARKYNFLSGVSGSGQTAATTIGQFGANMANNVAENYLQAGNAQAAGIIGQGNAMSNALGSVSDYYRLKNLLG